jgi:hypothetical protein
VSRATDIGHPTIIVQSLMWSSVTDKVIKASRETDVGAYKTAMPYSLINCVCEPAFGPSKMGVHLMRPSLMSSLMW